MAWFGQMVSEEKSRAWILHPQQNLPAAHLLRSHNA
jgi:hypothetical protein